MLSPHSRIAAALALSLALALPTLAAPAPAEGPAGSFEKYLPDSADGVISINVRQFLDSELIKKAGLDKLLTSDQAQAPLKALGLDPLKDIDRVIISNDKDANDPYFIVQGKFDPAKLNAAAAVAAKDKKEILKIHKCANGTYCEVTKLDELIQVPPQAAGQINLKDKSLFAVVADKGNIVLVGTKESAETVLAKAAGKKTTKLTNKDLPALIEKINPKQTIAVALPTPDERVKSITGGVTVTADLKVDLTVTAPDAEGAKAVNEMIATGLQQAKDTVGIFAINVKELQPALDILNAVKHDAKDNHVGITSDIKGETLEKLAKGIAEFAKKNGF